MFHGGMEEEDHLLPPHRQREKKSCGAGALEASYSWYILTRQVEKENSYLPSQATCWSIPGTSML